MKYIWVMVLASVSGLVFAEETGKIYAGLSYSQIRIKDDTAGTFNPTAVGVGLSVVPFKNLALDGYVFAGMNDASLAQPRNTTVTVKVKDGYGFNFHPFIELNNKWGLYAKLGRQYGSQETRITGLRTNTTQTNYAHTVYGLGVSYNLNSDWGISTEYLQSPRVSGETTSSSTLAMGLRYKF